MSTKTVRYAAFHLRSQSNGKRIRMVPVLEVDGRDYAGDWSYSAECTGELASLLRSYFRQKCIAGIVLDRFEECIDEAGGSASVLLPAIVHLRKWVSPTKVYEESGVDIPAYGLGR